MRSSATKATFEVRPSVGLERFLDNFKSTQPDVFDAMNLEIRKHISLQAESLNKRFPSPAVRIIYRYLLAREERLMAVLLDGRQLEEFKNEISK